MRYILFTLVALIITGCDTPVVPTTSPDTTVNPTPDAVTTADSAPVVTPHSPTPDPVVTPSPTPSTTPTVVVYAISLNAVSDLTVAEAASANFSLASTTNGTPVYACSGCPAFVVVNPSTGQVIVTPTYGDAGVYNLSASATTHGVTSSASFALTVTHTNRAPTLIGAVNKSVAENSNLLFSVSASDPDQESVTITSGALPSGATFVGSNFDWTPSYSQSGSYNVDFYGNDGHGGTDHKQITIVVSNTNRPPVFSGTGAKTVAENSALSFDVTAPDPDGQSVTITATSVLPVGASFNGTTFAWTPTCSQEGSYNVTFRATDGIDPVTVTTPITVTHTNCYTPAWGESGFVNTYLHGYSSSAGVVDISIRLPTATDGDGPLTVAYAGIWFDCFNQTASTALLMNDVTPHWNLDGYPEYDFGQTIRVTVAGTGLTDKFWFLFKATDSDGVTIYAWKRIQRDGTGSWTAIPQVMVLQGTSYNTVGADFCSATVNPNGFQHAN